MRGFICIASVIIALMMISLGCVAFVTGSSRCPLGLASADCLAIFGVSSLIAAVLAGGAAGGFTNSLIGGQEFGMRHPISRARASQSRASLSAIPGKVRKDVTGEIFDPGYLGDTFIGLMAGCVGIAFVTQNLKSSPWDFVEEPLVNKWFLDFSIAYVCGFLGLKLIKMIAENILTADKVQDAKQAAERAEEKVDEVKKDVDDNKGAALFLNGIVALQQKDYDTAEQMFEESMKVEGWRTTRALVSLARIKRRRGDLVGAIALLTEAIAQEKLEKMRSRIAIAFWNRACYRSLISSGAPVDDVHVAEIISDIQRSLQIEPSYAQDIQGETDFDALRGNPKFEEFFKSAVVS